MADPIFVDTPNGEQLVILARAAYDAMMSRVADEEAEEAADIAAGERGLAEWEAHGRQGFELEILRRMWPYNRAAARVPDTEPRRHPDLVPGHPGGLLREIVVPATGRDPNEVARLLGVSTDTLRDVLAERAAITPDLALRLGKMFGDGPEPWLRMQGAHDAWTLSRAIGAELEAIPLLAAEG